MNNNWLENTDCQPIRIKYLCKESFSGGTPSTSNSEYWNGNIPWIASGEIQNCDVANATDFITLKGLQNSSTRLIEKDSALLAMTGATCANVGYLKIKTTANQSVYAFVPKNNQQAKFLFYALIAMREEILSKQNGGAQAGINGMVCKNLYIPSLAYEKQQKIVSYLDKKVGAIDGLISNLEKQIEELRNYKFSFISEYVSSNKSNMLKIKYKNNIIDKKCEKENEPYFALENIESNSGKFIETEVEYSSIGSIVCKKGDICFGKLRPYLRKFYMVSQDVTCSSEIAVFREKDKTEYMFYLIQSEEFIQMCNAFSEGTKMPRINIEKIKNWKFNFPSVEEQKTFVSKMKKLDKEIEILINVKQKKIEELKRYKKSLIYECVTGKKEVI